MSKDRKRIRRKWEMKLAREQRFQSQGAGLGRKTLNMWTWSNRLDMAIMMLARNMGRTKTQRNEADVG